MRPNVVIGVCVALAALAIAQLIEGVHFSALFNLPAMLIVCGGTLGAIIVQTSGGDLGHVMALRAWLLRPPQTPRAELITKLVHWGRQSRKEGLLSLEDEVDVESDAFVCSGLRLLVDGTEPGAIREALEVELGRREQRD
jgi:chemotaxis protein MotA